jgi:phosphoribosyl 1,2-cyclic phosphodiesterase
VLPSTVGKIETRFKSELTESIVDAVGRATRQYTLQELAPGGTFDLFFHPYGADEFAAFDIQPFPGNHPGFEPAVQLEVREVHDHSDGRGYALRFTNRSVANGNPRPGVTLVEFVETVS